MRFRKRAALAFAVLLATAAGCAKRADEAPSATAASQAPPPPPAQPAPAAEPESPSSLGDVEERKKRELLEAAPEPSTLEEAERAFADSKKELDELVGPLPGEKLTGVKPPAPLAAGDTRCPRACQAFDSLRRSGDAICRLAGERDQRCTRARELVKQNESRVSICACDKQR
jgi:hypothetical protein